jgi:hypothetical protein
MNTMKFASACLALVGGIAGIVAAYYWYQSSKIPYTTSTMRYLDASGRAQSEALSAALSEPDRELINSGKHLFELSVFCSSSKGYVSTSKLAQSKAIESPPHLFP